MAADHQHDEPSFKLLDNSPVGKEPELEPPESIRKLPPAPVPGIHELPIQDIRIPTLVERAAGNHEAPDHGLPPKQRPGNRSPVVG